MPKKTVLLHWWYEREDLLLPFLKMTDAFDFVLLFYKYPIQENEKAQKAPFRKIYWSDYNTPAAILNDVKPDLIIFFDINSGYTIGLLQAGKCRHIPTIYLSHGLHGNMQDVVRKDHSNENSDLPERYRKDYKYYKSDKWKSIVFLLSAFNFLNASHLKFLFRFIQLSRKKIPVELKLYYNQSACRIADYYIFFAAGYSVRFKERDKLEESKILYCGPYTMDGHFRNMSSIRPVSSDCKSWLFIDQPMTNLSTDEIRDFYSRLSQIAGLKGKQLVIKLHPLNYNATWLPFNDSIRYYRDEKSLAELVNNASGCLGFFSALLLPVIYKRKCILFNPGNNSIVVEWEKTKAVAVRDFYDFDAQSIDFDKIEISDADRNTFSNQFIHDLTGNSTERLKTVLKGIVNQ